MSAVEAVAEDLPHEVRSGPVIEAIGVSRSFGNKRALLDVSLSVQRGEIHALLGPNGAGKTTLVRILTGLADPDTGSVRVLGSSRLAERGSRRLIGSVPSGDRTFYLRISGLENLLFYGRLQGLTKAAALERARSALSSVGLDQAVRQPVGEYSHGMQKRLSVARALLVDPPALFVDEATHDLDPAGARKIQELVSSAAARGAAVIWTTQRIDEIRGFADRVTVLRDGGVRFSGTVPQLMAVTAATRFLVRLRAAALRGEEVLDRATAALGSTATISPSSEEDGEHFVLALRDEETIGHVASELHAAGIDVVACREERSAIEAAFLFLTEDGP
jgi:ABC-2 type transport system ATP-binding protein